ncbi:hypothetical protein GR11A_00007 [Vibrio phage vB_VcorM_GR11A]|nr:hypothetical protein GR11A_00007 [Vibrio phage vB_VcorM_GR11A]
MSNKIVKQLSKDSDYSRFINILNTVNLEPKILLEEVTRLHTSRKSRLLNVKGTISSAKITKAALQDTAFRSRVVEIRSQVRQQLNALDSGFGIVHNALLGRYAGSLLKPYNTKAEKESVIASLKEMQRAQKLIDDFSSLVELCEDVIEDIDKSAWALKLAMQGLEIASRDG